MMVLQTVHLYQSTKILSNLELLHSAFCCFYIFMKAKCTSRQLSLHIISKGEHKGNIKPKITQELLQQEGIMSWLINLSDGKKS